MQDDLNIRNNTQSKRKVYPNGVYYFRAIQVTRGQDDKIMSL